MMMVGVILAVVVIVLTMFIKTITEPLQHMIDVSRAISAGDLRQITGIKTRSELSQLSAAIDDMSTNLVENPQGCLYFSADTNRYSSNLQ